MASKRQVIQPTTDILSLIQANAKEKLAPALCSALLGLILVYAAGFAETQSLHNAAHDGRHAAGFPCH